MKRGHSQAGDATPESAADFEGSPSPPPDAAHELLAAEPSETEEPHAERGATAAAAAAENEEIARLTAERDHAHDRMLRALADFDNYRKRVQREQAEQRQFGIAEALRAILPALDGLERALGVRSATAEDLRKGIEMVERQLLESLRRLGLEPIAAAGQQFDPHVHEAVEMVETGDAPDQSVIEELQRGYKLKERLIRPAMVRVARHPEDT